MTLAEHPGRATGPGSSGTLLAAPSPTHAGAFTDLSLPDLHCAACIRTVETGLARLPGVSAVRVNLSRKQVRVQTTPGLPPETLIDALTDLGYDAQLIDAATLGATADTRGRALLTRIAVAGFAMMNVMLLSVAVWSGATDATRAMFYWISAMIALPAIAYCGQPFYASAAAALRAARLNMDVPISVALILATAMSLFETAEGGTHAYFEAALSLTFFLLAGRYLDHRTRRAARSAAAELAALEVPRVIRQTATGRETVNLSQVAIDDHVVVLPGARIPVDGTVTEGVSNIDQSLLTGESLPVAARTGTSLTAGALNLTGPLTLRATGVGDDTTLRRMVTMIDAAESARNRYTALADRAAAIYAPLVHLLALAAFIGWMLIDGDPRHAIGVAIAVLIITCPCALGLAVPAVSTAAAGALFRRGVLIKDGTALERLAQIDTVVFDKTGTLTMGQLGVGSLVGLDTTKLSILLALAQGSTHPVAQAIAAGLAGQDISAAALTDATEHPGLGIAATWQGRRVRLGSAAWTGGDDQTGHGAHLKIGKAPADFIPLTARLRPDTKAMVQTLQARGYALHLISGDTAAATSAVAADLGIGDFHADQSPADKITYLQTLAAQGRRVLMVGDGLNDTGALAAAQASLSPASAADASRAASDAVILGASLGVLPGLLDIARRARRRIVENFAIAATYNLIAIPIALAGLATPLAAAIAMSLSSITVLLNALRVARLR